MTDDQGPPSPDPPLPFEHPCHTLRRLGIAARKRLSQNFLCQPEQARRIVDLAWWPPETPVLEVGGGTGVLTDAILARYPDLQVAEVDVALAAHLRDRYAGFGVEVMETDAREIQIGAGRQGPVGVFGNLPYGITTDLLMWLIHQRRDLAGAVIMVQREYADRLTASPGTKVYGSLSVFAAFHLEVRERLRVGTGSFHPAPQVDSTVLALSFRDPPGEVDAAFLERVVRAAFAHRRKMMRTNLAGELGLPVGEMETVVAAVAGSGMVRAEELSPEQFRELAGRLGEMGVRQEKRFPRGNP